MLRLRKIQRHHTCFHPEGSPCFNVGESVAIVPSAPGGLPEWPKGADCKSAVIDFVGSNPSPATFFVTSRRPCAAPFLRCRTAAPLLPRRTAAPLLPRRTAATSCCGAQDSIGCATSIQLAAPRNSASRNCARKPSLQKLRGRFDARMRVSGIKAFGSSPVSSRYIGHTLNFGGLHRAE